MFLKNLLILSQDSQQWKKKGKKQKKKSYPCYLRKVTDQKVKAITNDNPLSPLSLQILNSMEFRYRAIDNNRPPPATDTTPSPSLKPNFPFLSERSMPGLYCLCIVFFIHPRQRTLLWFCTFRILFGDAIVYRSWFVETCLVSVT